jgi:hypothetical protein
VQPFVYQFTLFQGKPDRAMAKLCVALPLEGIVLGTSAGWWRQEVVWCLSSTSMTPSIGGMAQQCLRDGCAKMNSRRGGGGTVWRRGGVDGKPGERLRFGLTP